MLVIELNERKHAINIRPESDDYQLKDNELDFALVPNPNDFQFHAKEWNGETFVEGLSEAEIQAIVNAPKELTELELMKNENKRLQDQLNQTNLDLQGFMDFYFSTLV